MQEEERHKKNRLAENTGTALAVAAALEVVQSNANRSSSVWTRVGGFFLNVLIGIGTLTLFDTVVGAFRGKKKHAHDNTGAMHNTQIMEAADHEPTKTSWAQDVSEEKSCGCPYRSPP